MPFITAPDGVNLYYETIGKGEPLLLVGGRNSDHHIWNLIHKDFAKGSQRRSHFPRQAIDAACQLEIALLPLHDEESRKLVVWMFPETLSSQHSVDVNKKSPANLREIFYILLFLYLNELIWLGSTNRAWRVRLAKFDVATDRAKIEFDLG